MHKTLKYDNQSPRESNSQELKLVNVSVSRKTHFLPELRMDVSRGVKKKIIGHPNTDLIESIIVQN
jgi:hypothetical protein